MIGDFARADTTGMSLETAKQYNYEVGGVESSENAAMKDLEKVRQYSELFTRAEQERGVKKELIAAIASRETRVGESPPRPGRLGIMGIPPNGDGAPMTQSDSDSDDPIYALIKRGVEELIEKNKQIKSKKRRDGWTPEQILRGGIAAYNFGVQNIQTVQGVDSGGDGDDYSSDVIARAQYFQKNWPA